MGYPLANKVAAEFIGTFLLVLTVGCNVLSKNADWGGVSIACVLMVMIYSLGKVSGGHFNPAVSLAVTLAAPWEGGRAWRTFFIYAATQVVAGIAGALCYAWLFKETFNLAPAAGFGIFEAGLCELLYTFMLCFVVLNVACASKRELNKPEGERNHPNQYYGLSIGFVIVAGAYGAGAVSGGCFNPAVAIAIDVSSAGKGFGWCIAYTAFEFAGAFLATIFYGLVRPEEVHHDHAEEIEEPDTVQCGVSEFLGTFFLVLTVGLNVLAKSPGGAFSIAASLMCMIYALGNVSGAHFNPAVTVAILLSGRVDMHLSKAFMYFAAQLLGGTVAVFTYKFIYHGKTFPLDLSPGFGWLDLAIAETIFTFVLCYVVLCSAVDKLTANSTFFGLAIGSCVTIGGLSIGVISGGSLNPAVSIAIATSFEGQFLHKAGIYTVFEVLGAMAAAGLLKITHGPPDEDKDEFQDEETPVSPPPLIKAQPKEAPSRPAPGVGWDSLGSGSFNGLKQRSREPDQAPPPAPRSKSGPAGGASWDAVARKVIHEPESSRS